MLLALSGVTGVGKTFFSDLISKKLNFKKIQTIRTREMREFEKDKNVGLFLTKSQLEELKKEGKIVYDFTIFNNIYAYKKDEIYSYNDSIFEMYYTTIDDFKKIRRDIVCIYILPTNMNIPIEQLKKRNLAKEKELFRIRESEKQYNNFINDIELQKKFDYIIYNNYDKDSENKILNLVRKIKEERNRKYGTLF